MFSLLIKEGKTHFLFLCLFKLTLVEFPFTFLGAVTTLSSLWLLQRHGHVIPAKKLKFAKQWKLSFTCFECLVTTS